MPSDPPQRYFRTTYHSLPSLYPGSQPFHVIFSTSFLFFFLWFFFFFVSALHSKHPGRHPSDGDMSCDYFTTPLEAVFAWLDQFCIGYGLVPDDVALQQESGRSQMTTRYRAERMI